MAFQQFTPDERPTMANFNAKLQAIHTDAVLAALGGFNPNLLDNAYFIGGGSQQGGGQFPINQRGQTEYIGQGYTIDRWARRGTGVTEEDNQKIKTEVTEGGIKISAPDPANISGEYHDFSQRIENYKDLLGKTVTVSLLIDDFENVGAMDFGLYSSNGIFTNTTALCRRAGIHSAGFYTATATIPESIAHSGINFCIRSWMNEGGGHFVLRAANAHDADGNWVLNDPPPNYALELVKCQRHQIFGPLTALRYHSSSGIQRMFVPTPVPMRVNPEIIGTPQAWSVDGNKQYNATISVNSFQKNGVVLNVAGATIPVYVFFPQGSGLDSNL